MSKLVGKFCSAGHMHDNAFFPGLGEVKKELIVGANGANRVESIEIDQQFIVVTIYGTQTRRTYTLPIPVTNFKFLVLDEKLSAAKPLLVVE